MVCEERTQIISGGWSYTSGRIIMHPPPMEFFDWYTTTTLGKLLRVSRLTILRMEKRGQLKPTKYIHRGKISERRYSGSDVADYLGEMGYNRAT